MKNEYNYVMRILLIEDDPMIGRGLHDALRRESMSVDWVTDGHDGLEALKSTEYMLCLLDLGLPGLSGTEILRLARQSGNKTPAVMITARDALDDRVAGLDLGADDYLVKPFEIRELLARIRAVIRRNGGQAVSMIGTAAAELDLANHELRYRGQVQLLPAREFALMAALLERPGTILSRTQLEERIYGWGEEVESNAIDVLIHYVRRKFDNAIIRNVRGAGWMVPRDQD
jgi:two-component system OmpR family response regulator